MQKNSITIPAVFVGSNGVKTPVTVVIGPQDNDKNDTLEISCSDPGAKFTLRIDLAAFESAINAAEMEEAASNMERFHESHSDR